MLDMGDFKTRSISGVSDELMERFDLVAKRLVGTRSALIKILMKSVVENARCQWEHEAKTSQFIQHSIDDTLKTCGHAVPIEAAREVWKVVKEAN